MAGVPVDAALLGLSLVGLALALGVLWTVGRAPAQPGGAALPGAFAGLWLLLLSAKNGAPGFLGGVG